MSATGNRERREENIAAIAYGAAINGADVNDTMLVRYGDALEGQIGLLRYLIEAASMFTAAQIVVELADVEYDWYTAVDVFVDKLLFADAILDDKQLLALAHDAIESAKETP